MSEDGIISSSSEASAVGFKAVQKVMGTLNSLVRKESNFKNDDGSPAKDQVEISIDDAIVLEMRDNQPIPELKEDRFVDWMAYAKRGEQPTKQSSFVRGFVKSAEQLQEARGKSGQGWRELVGQLVTIERKPIAYTFDKGTDKERKEEFPVWHFVENEDSVEGSDDYVAKIVVGKTPQMAARDLMMDVRTKNNTELRTAVRNQQPIVGLEVIDGKYQQPGTGGVEDPANDS
uniref:Uncharacterized protein n=1 Tax=viral metagenome TaxID=1070528 RepID=A0A6H1ZIH4_9ZZZZ